MNSIYHPRLYKAYTRFAITVLYFLRVRDEEIRILVNALAKVMWALPDDHPTAIAARKALNVFGDAKPKTRKQKDQAIAELSKALNNTVGTLSWDHPATTYAVQGLTAYDRERLLLDK